MAIADLEAGMLKQKEYPPLPYDMKERTPAEIRADMTAAGIPPEAASDYSAAAGLSGSTAKKFLMTKTLIENSPEQQKRLFERTYLQIEADVRRISDKKETVAAYGSLDWDQIHPAIRDVLIDLRFRGDYTPSSRKLIQKLAVDNDLTGFTKVLSDRSNWKNVPDNRFERRKSYIKQLASK